MRLHFAINLLFHLPGCGSNIGRNLRLFTFCSFHVFFGSFGFNFDAKMFFFSFKIRGIPVGKKFVGTSDFAARFVVNLTNFYRKREF